jgi:hypothetical protein
MSHPRHLEALMLSHFTEVEVAGLFKAFRAEVSMPTEHGEFRFSRHEAADSGYLGIFDYTMVGMEYMPHENFLNFAKDFLREQRAKTVTAPYEVVLYPGGGFTSKFNMIITSDFLIYLKIEGWNS